MEKSLLKLLRLWTGAIFFLLKIMMRKQGVVLASWDVVGVHEVFKDCRQIRRHTFPAIFSTATRGTVAELPLNELRFGFV